MSTEPKTVQATVGPYAGQRLTMSPEDADAAINDGWAVDPFAPAPAEGDQPKEQKPETEEDRMRKVQAAEKAARKLRGEKEPDDDKTKQPAARQEGQRDMQPEQDRADYSTRDAPRRR